MKRILLYILVLIALCFAPIKGANIGNLRPVEVVHIYKTQNQVAIATDTGDFGIGETGLAALENLKATTPGTIYLDTADFLIIAEGAEPFVKYLSSHLKSSVRICLGEKGLDLAEAGAYLAVHRPSVKLKDYRERTILDQLKAYQGRLELQKNKWRNL